MFDDQTRRMVLIFGCIFVGVVLVSITMEWTLSAAPRTPNVELGPDHTRQANTGQTIVYHHILTNTGTTTDTFWLDLSSTQGWPVELWWGPYPTGTLGTLGTLLIPQVGPQMTIPLRINLTVPSGAAGVTAITIITATSQLSPTVQDTATDTTIVLCKIYLPLVVKGWPLMPYSPTLDPINNIDGNGFYTVTWSLAESAQTYSLEEDDNDG